MSSSEEDENEGSVEHTPETLMQLGLEIVHFTKKRISKSNNERNVHRFKVHFGCTPHVACEIFKDLQQTDIEQAFVPPGSRNIRHYLMALHMVKVYPTEIEREAVFDISPSHSREWCWFFIKKISALKHLKILWPDDNEDIFT